MKNVLISSALLTVSGSLFAAAVAPNSFRCVNKAKKVSVEFIEPSSLGEASFIVKEDGMVLTLADGLKLNAPSETAIGKIVSADDTRIMDVTRSYSLIIPSIVLQQNSEPVVFETQLVSSVSSGFFRPESFSGATQTNHYIKVRCTASAE